MSKRRPDIQPQVGTVASDDIMTVLASWGSVITVTSSRREREKSCCHLVYICTVGSRAGLGFYDVAPIKQFGCFFCLVRLSDQTLPQPCCSPGPHGCIHINALFRLRSEVLYQTPKFSLFSVPYFAFWNSLGKQVLDFSWMAINGERCSSSTASAAWPQGAGRIRRNDTRLGPSEAEIALPSSSECCKIWTRGLSNNVALLQIHSHWSTSPAHVDVAQGHFWVGVRSYGQFPCVLCWERYSNLKLLFFFFSLVEKKCHY